MKNKYSSVFKFSLVLRHALHRVLSVSVRLLLPWKYLSRRNKKRVLVFDAVVILVLIPLLIFLLKHAGITQAAWFNEDWGYRQRVDITNSGSAQTDFQVSFTLNTDSLFDNGKLRSDCNDIRVTDVNGKLLPYWIEQMATACGNGQTAQTIWVKVPSISTTGDTLYVYYGNPQAGSYSDGKKVFTFFDDFSGSSIDTSKWTITNSTGWSVGSGVLTGTSTTGRLTSIQTFTTSSQPFLMASRHDVNTMATNGHEILGTYLSSSNAFGGFLPHSDTSGFTRTDSTWNNFNPSPVTFSSYSIYKVYGADTSNMFVKMEQGANTYTSGAFVNTVSAEPIVLGERYDDALTGQSYDATWDWIYVRKYAATEPSVAAPTNEEKSPAPVAYWKFDEGTGTSAKDSTTNGNVGTLTNMASSAATNSGWIEESRCVSGKCLAFDGSDDRVEKTSSSGLNITDKKLTVAAWVKISGNQSSTVGTIVAKQRGATYAYNLNIRSDQPDKPSFSLYDGTNNPEVVASSAISRSVWHYIVGTYDGSTMTIYVDGVSAGTLSSTIDISSSDSIVRVGANAGTTANLYFNGFIDEPKIYGYARTAAQIKVDYNNGANVLGASDANKNLSNGLVGYWKMDESSWTIDCSTSSVLDSSGNSNNGKSCPTTTGPAGGATGKFGNAGSFDGTNDYVEVANSTSIGVGDVFTLSAWVKRTGIGTAQYITQKDAGFFAWGFDSNNKLFLDKQGTAVIFTSTNSYTDTTNWHHYVITKNGSSLSAYVDGTLISGTFSDQTLINNSNAMSIGANSGGTGSFFNGRIDETRIYNRALPDREVQQLYNFAPGPVAYYNFEEKQGTTANDSSTNGNTGTLTGGPSWTQGKYGSGLNFDGSDDEVTVSSVYNLGNSNMTIETWVYLNTNSESGAFVKIGTASNGIGIGVGGSTFDDSGNNLLMLYEAVRWIDTGIDIGTGWHHVAIAIDSSGVPTGYIDGVSIGTFTGTNAVTPTTSTNIGGYTGGGPLNRHGNYKTDETKIYNYPRTAGQIVEDMNGGHPLPGSPVGSPVLHLKFDDGFGNYASNSGNMGRGGDAGIISMASPATADSGWTQHGKFGKALSFDGINDNVKVIDTTNGPLDVGQPGLTVSAWINPDTIGSDTYAIVNKNGPYLLWIDGPNKRLYTGLLKGGTWYWAYGSTNDLVARQWQQIVMTYDGTSRKLYVNGKQSGSTDTQISGIIDTSNANISIGYDDCCARFYFDGKIDEAKIYASGLTTDQVKLEYNRGSSQVLGSLSDTSGLTGGSVASNSASAEYCVPGDTTSCASPVARWDFEEGKGSSANDKSGNGYTGVWSGTGARWVAGKMGKGGSFNGSTDIVTVSGLADGFFTASWTQSFWIKTTSTTNLVITEKGSNNAFIQTGGVSGQIRAGPVGADVIETTGSPVVNDGKWHFVSVTFSSSKALNIYIDGVVRASSTSVNNAASSATAYALGARVGPSVGFVGQLDDVRVYDYARSGSQVAWDYNQGKPTGHYKFDECQGGTINDSIRLTSTISGTLTVGGSGTQTAVGTCSTASTAWGNGVTGKFNYSLKFDGTDDYVSIPDADMLNDFPKDQDFSVAAWLKIPATQNNTVATENMIIEKWDEAGASDYPYVIRVVNQTGGASAGKVYGARYDGTNAVSVSSTNALNDNLWHMVTFTKRGSTLSIYIDGKLNATTTDTTTTTTTNTSALYLGRRGSGNGYYYTGGIDDLRIFNYGLTASQIKVLYNNGAVTFGPNTGAP